MNTNHIAFYISNAVNKQQLIDQLLSGSIIAGLNLIKGAVFSEIALNNFIREERLHGHFEVLKNNAKHSLQQFSEGERKKVLLNYIISNNPDFIIVDNVLDNLDAASQLTVTATLIALSDDIQIIQISNRKSEILPFVKDTYCLMNKAWILFDQFTDNELEDDVFVQLIPSAYQKIVVEDKSLVRFQRVNVSYNGIPVLKDISLEIKKKEFWQITGSNGAGKSTLLSLITGDNVKGYGQDITLFGIRKGSGESVWEHKRKIGYFSSEMKLGFARKTSLENMILSGYFDSIGLYDKPSKIQINYMVEWLILLGLYELRKKNFLFLTLGQQRMVLIARAMIKHPPLLILDEPMAGLDDTSVRLMVQLINKIDLETETAIIYVSHKKEEGLNPSFTFELEKT